MFGNWFTVLLVLICVFANPCFSLRFLGDRETFAKFPKWDACINASIAFEFRTRQNDGLLMYTDDNGKYDYLQLAVTEGAIRLWINFVREKEQSVEIELGRNLNDGNWHRVEVKRNRMETTLLVDNNQSSKVSFGSDFSFGDRLETNNYMYFGGVPGNYRQNLARLNIPANVLNSPFQGEIRNILYFNCSCLPVR
ncbi:unnamed protein product [Candidula unifasciata]|uniref:Laminin G domain-containing protein n=1 Tax=Candidula unifasciata TaxID=100452 RepID=A0A8S3Z650_9EUPU|nr:unnamed protein product [Candidula unifasciata]